MDLNRVQSKLYSHLQEAVRLSPNRIFVYHTEWLGYLPFGLYHWIVVDRRDVTRTLPFDWGRGDLDALESEGCIAKIDEWANPDDQCETAVTYELRRG